MRRSLLLTPLALVIAVLGALALAGVASASRAHATATVTVIATDFKFKLSPLTVKAGMVTFKVVNKGKVMHDFKIDGKRTPVLAPGKSATLTVTLKNGKYPYVCTVDAHAAAGMKGTLIVR
jgi:nitrite reductase (NO-forming)